jgi:RimJ/RimL family protein N-acetyltransferase
VFLAGGRVSLRPIEEADLDFLHKHINDARVWRSLAESLPRNRDQEREWFEAVVCDDESVHLLVTPDSTPVGTVGLDPVDWADGSVELGYWVAPDYQGQGYGTEAVELVVGYAFDQLGLRRLSARVIAFNEPSVRLLERVGFVREGTRRETAFVDGEYHDTHWYGLLEAEWRERSSGGGDAGEGETA